MTHLRALSALLVIGSLAGCGASGEEELRQWMAEERAKAKPYVKPLSEPKKFSPVAYQAESGADPFNSEKLTRILNNEAKQASSNTALLTAEQNRRKEPLEAFPLDTMSMVGSLNKKGKPTALLKVDNLLHQVSVGSYLGQNYGKIVSIDETTIKLREIVQDAAGEWTERMTSLELQEGMKK